MSQSVEEKIKQRRLQILVHSYIYYELNENIVSDDVWSRWAKELVRLQKDHPDISKTVERYEEFIDFDGSSGAFLIFDEWVQGKAHQLLSIKKRYTDRNKSIFKQKKKVSRLRRRKLF